MPEFIQNIISLSVGAFLTLISGYFASKINVTDELDKEITKERILAYKKIYSLISKLNIYSRPTNSSIPEGCYLKTYIVDRIVHFKGYSIPFVFSSRKILHDYIQRSCYLLNENRILLDQKTINDSLFLNSYLNHVYELSTKYDDKFLRFMGFILANELDKLREKIENDITKYLNSNKKDRFRLNMNEAKNFESNEYPKTELFKIFLKKSNIPIKFGDLEKCNYCPRKINCPLNDESGI